MANRAPGPENKLGGASNLVGLSARQGLRRTLANGLPADSVQESEERRALLARPPLVYKKWYEPFVEIKREIDQEVGVWKKRYQRLMNLVDEQTRPSEIVDLGKDAAKVILERLMPGCMAAGTVGAAYFAVLGKYVDCFKDVIQAITSRKLAEEELNKVIRLTLEVHEKVSSFEDEYTCNGMKWKQFILDHNQYRLGIGANRQYARSALFEFRKRGKLHSDVAWGLLSDQILGLGGPTSATLKKLVEKRSGILRDIFHFNGFMGVQRLVFEEGIRRYHEKLTVMEKGGFVSKKFAVLTKGIGMQDITGSLLETGQTRLEETLIADTNSVQRLTKQWIELADKQERAFHRDMQRWSREPI